MEPAQRFEACGVKNAILFFGSARARSREEHARTLARTQDTLADPRTSPEDRARLEQAVVRLQRSEWMCEYYDKARSGVPGCLVLQ